MTYGSSAPATRCPHAAQAHAGIIQFCPQSAITVGVPHAAEMRAELSPWITIIGMDLNSGRMIYLTARR